MKIEPTVITTTAANKVYASICAEGHDRVVYYSNTPCPLCEALDEKARLQDQLDIARYDLITAQEARQNEV